MNSKSCIILIIIIFIILGCNEKPRTEYNFKKIDDNIIEVLKEKKIFFGHQSVGYNIIRGIENLGTGIQVQELEGGHNVIKPGIYHATNGENSFPKSKVDAFKARIRDRHLGNEFDVAFFKFCYVDFNKDSDVVEIFNYYTDAIESIKKEFPKLRIVHVTTPLTTHTYGIKSFIKNLLSGDISNVKRNQFNALLVNKYKNKDPIYDLAMIVSTHPDGKREIFMYQNQTYYALVKEYTYDRGHLNEVGRHLAAKELLKVLSAIP